MSEPWTEEEIEALSNRFQIRPNCRLHAGAEDYHFPRQSFLENGYAPPGGYVKDFSVVWHEGRLHLFHIDGRPGEVCWITGNEISFGHASTSDLRHWIRHPMPLAVGERSWESEHIWAPYIYRRDGLFHMFYMGSGQGQSCISYATSPDLERWQRWERGPIRGVAGRDPFLFEIGGRTVLLYTDGASPHISAASTGDMESWETLPPILTIPGGKALESSSLHPLRDGYVLWFNDSGVHWSPHRAAYVFSRDAFSFEASAIQTFEFRSKHPGLAPSPECPDSKPFPLSIELIARSETRWLVSYFRWQDDRNRFFLGEIDWTAEPATITEITETDDLKQCLAAYRLG